MVPVMKPTIALLMCIPAVAAAAPPKAELARVHSVYLLPMSNGIDQYLANRLTNLGVFQVVTDPHRADAVFTDRLGDTFESRLGEWFPEPSPKPAEKKPSAQPAKPEGDAPPAKAEKPEETTKEMKGDTGVPFSSFRRAKGTVFLVDPRTRVVLWSIYAQPKSSQAAELDRTAERITKGIKDDLKSRQHRGSAP
jgi:hypothetical protein